MKRNFLLLLELQQLRQRAHVPVVAVQPIHHDESSLVQRVPLEPLVLKRDVLKGRTAGWKDKEQKEVHHFSKSNSLILEHKAFSDINSVTGV